MALGDARSPTRALDRVTDSVTRETSQRRCLGVAWPCGLCTPPAWSAPVWLSASFPDGGGFQTEVA